MDTRGTKLGELTFSRPGKEGERECGVYIRGTRRWNSGVGASRVDIYIYIPRPRCHPTVDDPPSPVSPRSPPGSSLSSRSILSGLCSPRPRVPFRSLPIQPLAVGRRWCASEEKEEQRRVIVELRRIQRTVSRFFNLLRGVLLLLDVLGCVRGDQRPRIDHDFPILEHHLSLHSRLDLPGRGYLLLLPCLPFL